MRKLLVLAALFAGLSSAAQAQTILALNAVGPVNQINAVSLQASNTNVLGGIVILNDISAQSTGNVATVSQTNDVAFLTANVQTGINQANVLTAQISQTNVLGALVILNDISSVAVGNVAVVDQTNNLALGVVNIQTGINQLNLATVQAAQTNVAGIAVAGNSISATAGGNSASVTSVN